MHADTENNIKTEENTQKHPKRLEEKDNNSKIEIYDEVIERGLSIMKDQFCNNNFVVHNAE